MNETKLLETLRSIAHYIVRNEIMTEHFLLEGKLPVSRDELGAKARELDGMINTRVRDRFPDLFSGDS